MELKKRYLICILCIVCCINIAGCAFELPEDKDAILNKIPGVESILEKYTYFKDDFDNTKDENIEKKSFGEKDKKGTSWGYDNAEETLENNSLLVEWENCYVYEQLDDAEKVWYKDIANILGSMSTEVYLSKEPIGTLTEGDIDRIFRYVMYDHPELFFVQGYSYVKYTKGEEIINYAFSGQYTMEYDKAQLYANNIEAKSKPIVSRCKLFNDDYDKIKYIYENIIYNTDYDIDAMENQNLYSVLVYGRSVCQGYAKTMQYLLKMSGVECTIVQGHVDSGEAHAWNLVKSNGNYYYVDCTWGDASYKDVDELEEEYIPEINYNYLNVTYDCISKTHIIDFDYKLPDCRSMDDNYFVREGLYYTDYDEERLRAAFNACLNQEEKTVLVKCADRLVYDEMVLRLIENQEVFKLLSDMKSTISYSMDDAGMILEFWMTK